MALLLVLHRAADYDAWRKVYDSVSDVPAFSNITSESVHRMVDDPDNVLVLHYFDSVDEARAFTALPELQEAIQRARVGVHILFVQRAAQDGDRHIDASPEAVFDAWLDPEKSPYLIQMPEVAYKQYEKTWKLPNLK